MTIFFKNDIDNSIKTQIQKFELLITTNKKIDDVIDESVEILFDMDSSNVVTGFVTLEPDSIGQPANIQFLEVRQEYRDKGIATKLLSSVIQTATKMGYKTVTSMPTGDGVKKEKTIHLLEKFGFIEDGPLFFKRLP